MAGPPGVQPDAIVRSRSGSTILGSTTRDLIEEGEPVEDHAPNPAPRRAPYSEVNATTEKLQHKFGGGHGPLSDQEIADVVRDETEELQDAPVQAFTSLIAENNARNRLQELADEADHEH
jgi:hypothetical protein